jgi:hypothetical protein
MKGLEPSPDLQGLEGRIASYGCEIVTDGGISDA